MNSSGAVALASYLLIALAELRMRRRLDGRGAGADEAPDVLFPWLTYVAIAGMVAVIVAMAFVDDVRSQLIPSFLSLAVVLAAAFVRYRQSEARGRVRTSKKPGAYGVPRAG